MSDIRKTLFSCIGISKQFDEREILRNVDFSISNGDKIGLIGPNGSGKSTLLKIIAGLLETDEGSVILGKGTKVEYLDQTHQGEYGLSGGEISKKLISRVISSGANLFLLDEPTNDLDQRGLEYLENFVSRSKNAFLIVSHDRAFLDKIVNKIIEIDPINKSLRVYSGNYSDYAKQRESDIRHEWEAYSDKLEDSKRMSKELEQRVSWVKKIEKKRKDKKRAPAQEREKPPSSLLRDKEGEAGRRARIMKDKLNKFLESTEEIKKPSRQLPVRIKFDVIRGSTKVFEAKGVFREAGNRSIGPIEISIQYGERWNIKGMNGAGKTTLLKMLVGEYLPDRGTIERGKDVVIGYVPQDRWVSGSGRIVLDDFILITGKGESEARKMLSRFKMTKDKVFKDISSLSPGEYSRLIIAELLAIKPNCLILDEPSNHLDLEILEELEKGIMEYEGTLIIVSHDRYFLKRLRLDHVFDMDSPGD
ncbi:MAG: ATP-binding cassette domain-containing protein [Candidatus Pacebacteria bacterium]|nr:ATP-binding cassette domain-containing protein [Candidatus Paceibacterota bacterium]